MNCLSLMWAADEAGGGTEADYQAWMTYEQELKDAGVFVAGAALQSHAAAAKYVRPATSKLSADQPMAPSGGQGLQIGGYYLIACDSDDEALSWARKMPTYGLVGPDSASFRPRTCDLSLGAWRAWRVTTGSASSSGAVHVRCVTAGCAARRAAGVTARRVSPPLLAT